MGLRWLSRLLCSALRYVAETVKTPAGVRSLPLVIELPGEGLTHGLYTHNKPFTIAIAVRLPALHAARPYLPVDNPKLLLTIYCVPSGLFLTPIGQPF